MDPGNPSNPPSSSRKRPFEELLADGRPTTLVCTVVAVDHTNLYYRVCSVCEKPLPDNIPPPPATNYTVPSACRHCNLRNRSNRGSSGSKHLFRVLMSVATETKVFVVIMFDRTAKVLFGCSGDEFSEFVKTHPFAGKVLKGELLRVTLSKPKNGNAQHVRVTSVVPLSSRFQPVIQSLRELYARSSSV